MIIQVGTQTRILQKDLLTQIHQPFKFNHLIDQPKNSTI